MILYITGQASLMGKLQRTAICLLIDGLGKEVDGRRVLPKFSMQSIQFHCLQRKMLNTGVRASMVA